MGIKLKDKIMFHSFREKECQQGFTTGIWYLVYAFGWSCWTSFIGLMVSKSEFKSHGLRLFPRRGEYEFAFQFWYCEPPAKNICGKDRRPIVILECFNCWWEVGRREKWEGNKGGRVVGWEGGKGERVVRWERWEGGEVARWQCEKSGRVGGSWFYSRVGDARWVQDFI